MGKSHKDEDKHKTEGFTNLFSKLFSKDVKEGMDSGGASGGAGGGAGGGSGSGSGTGTGTAGGNVTHKSGNLLFKTGKDDYSSDDELDLPGWGDEMRVTEN